MGTHKWSLKYKKSINCKNPHGFSQKQHCKYGRGKTNVTRKTQKNPQRKTKRKTKRKTQKKN
jgi:hypothetical protein